MSKQYTTAAVFFPRRESESFMRASDFKPATIPIYMRSPQCSDMSRVGERIIATNNLIYARDKPS
jgi:hypothetical protein